MKREDTEKRQQGMIKIAKILADRDVFTMRRAQNENACTPRWSLKLLSTCYDSETVGKKFSKR